MPCASVSANRTETSVEKVKPSTGLLSPGDAQRVEHRASPRDERLGRLAAEQDVGGERAALLRPLRCAAGAWPALDRRRWPYAEREVPGPRRAGPDLHAAERLRPLDDDDRNRGPRKVEIGDLAAAG